MTREQAQVAWSTIEREIEIALVARRPKLKSFEVHHTFAVARKAIVAVYQTSPSREHLREVALRAIGM